MTDFRILAVLALVLVALPAPGSSAQDARGAAANIERDGQRLRDVQSLDAMAETWREAVREPGDTMQALQARSNLDNPADAWRRAVDKVFDPKGMAGELARAQAEGLTAPERRALIAFRETVLGRALTVAETTSPLPKEEMADQAKLGAALSRSRVELLKDGTRRKLIERLLAEGGGIAMQVELLMSLSRGVAVGVALAAPGGQPRESTAEILAEVEKERPAMTAMMKLVAPPSLQLSYAKQSNADLDRYVRFLTSPAGRKNTAIVLKTFTRLISERGLAIGEAFAKELATKRL